MRSESHMWSSIGPGVFLSQEGEVHVCFQGCDRRSIRISGIDVCPISGITQGANAASLDDDDISDDSLSVYATDDIAPVLKSTRHVDPLNLDGVLIIKNAAQRVFSALFAKRICKPDAVMRASIAARMPGRDVESILAKIKASMLCSEDIDDLTELAFTFYMTLLPLEHKIHVSCNARKLTARRPKT